MGYSSTTRRKKKTSPNPRVSTGEMDQWKSEGFCQSNPADLLASDFHPSNNRLPNSLPESSQILEQEVKDPIAAKKVQKADREKLRRDRLNEQFLELGNAVDPDRPKNDKVTILNDTIQMMKDLTAQVNRLKAEYTFLSEESRELTQEKNELREEKAALKADMDSLNVQYQQRLRVMFPWAGMDPSVVMAPPPYPYTLPVPIPSGPIPMHPSLQPYPFFGNQNPAAIANPCSTFLPYPPPGNAPIQQPSSQYISPQPQPSSRSLTPGKRDSRSKPSDCQRGDNIEKIDDSNDVVTKLELKTPGSARPISQSDSVPDQLLSSEARKGKQWSSTRKGISVTDGSSPSRRSSSHGLQESSSNSVGDGSVTNN